MRFNFSWLFLTGILLFCAQAVTFGQKRDALSRETDSAVQGALKKILPDGKTGRRLLKPGEISLQNTSPELNSGFQSKIKLLQGKPKVKISNLDLGMGYSYIYDTSTVAKGVYSDVTGIYSYGVNYGVALSSIPFQGNISGNNGMYSSSATRLNDLYQFNFDPLAYKETLMQEVMTKIKPEVVLGTLLRRINAIKANYEQNLRHDLQGIQQEFAKEYGEQLDIPEDASDISVKDLSALRNRLFSNTSPESYKEGMERYQNMLRNPSASQDSSSKNVALREAKKMEALQKAFDRITSWKQKFEDNPTVKKMQSHLPFTPDNYKAYLKQPGTLADVIKKHGSLSSFQNIFLNLTKLDVGQNAVQNGQFSVQNVMNTGINTAFQNKNIGVGMMAGANNNPNPWLQGGLNSFVNNEYTSMAGLTLGTGTGSAFSQSVSINFFDFSNPSWADDPTQYLQSAYLPTAKRKDAVISLHSGLAFSEKHEIAVDLSKSFGSYKNLSGTNSSAYGKSAVKGLLGGEGQSNYAVAVDYKGEILKTDLQLLLKNAGLGYSNPGNMFIRRGETQVQFGVARNFFKRKLTVKYKTDYRNQHFDPEKNYTYISFSNKINGSWKIKRNSRVGLSYQNTSYTSAMQSLPLLKGGSTILQGDGSYRFRVAGKNITNTEILSYQRMELPSLIGDLYKSRSVFFAHTTMVPVKSSFAILSLMVNQSDNSDYYFNTSSVHSEASYTFTLFEKVRMLSGLGYYINSGWNRQVGLKEQVSFTASKNINVDVGIDYKKAVKIIRSELANPIFVNTSVSYRL